MQALGIPVIVVGNINVGGSGKTPLTLYIARELGSRGITVNAVAPGFVLTELTQDLNDELKTQITDRTPLGRFGFTR